MRSLIINEALSKKAFPETSSFIIFLFLIAVQLWFCEILEIPFPIQNFVDVLSNVFIVVIVSETARSFQVKVFKSFLKTVKIPFSYGVNVRLLKGFLAFN